MVMGTYDGSWGAKVAGLGLAGIAKRVRHKVFVSYHHARDQSYKDALEQYGKAEDVFVNRSVGDGEISDDMSTESIRESIRDNYLRDTTVTLVLIGQETHKRKHVDWEIYSSMHNGTKNKRNGIACIILPDTQCWEYLPDVGQAAVKLGIPSETVGYIGSGLEFREGYGALGTRLMENLVSGKIWVIRWERLYQNGVLDWLIESTFKGRWSAEFTFGTDMMRRNRP